MRGLLWACALLAVVTAGAQAAIDDGRAPAPVRYRPDRIVLQLAPAAATRAHALRASPVRARLAIGTIDRTAERIGVRRFSPGFPGARGPADPLAAFWYAELAPGADPLAAALAFAELADVRAADPIAITPVAAVPNDSLWSVSRHLFQPSRRDVHAVEAWDVERGDPDVVLAIIDTGVLLDHPDLAARIWRNPAERDGKPGVDDDANGYVDDVRGWDFVALASDSGVIAGEDWRDADDDPNDLASHGTAVAGVAAAHTDNGIGIAGIAWDIRIMALRAGWSATSNPLGVIDLSAAAEAVVYATAMGAQVINCSFATVTQADFSAAIETALAAGVTVVFAAGNNGSPHAAGQIPGVLSVAATEPSDAVAAFSNTSPYVSLAAPGLSLPATTVQRASGDSASLRRPAYTTGASGTSFAAPLVAGAAALLQSRQRALGAAPLSPLDLRVRLMESADAIEPENPLRTNYGAGRLNAAQALEERRGTFHVAAAGSSIGPAIVIAALRGEPRAAFAMSTGEIVFIGGTSGDTLLRIPLPSRPVSAMAAADPGTGAGSALWVAAEDRRIHAFDLQGRPLAGWPVNATSVSGARWVAPALGDLDGDGVLEVVWGGTDGQVHAWRADGTIVPGFPRGVTTAGTSILVALADLDGVPGTEIVTAHGDGKLLVLDGGGSPRGGWPVQIPFAPVDVLVTSLPGAGPAIVVAGGPLVIAWAENGTLLRSRTMPIAVRAGLATADVDADGVKDIVVPMIDHIGVLSAEFTWLPGWPRRCEGVLDGPPVVGGVSKRSGSGVLVSLADGPDGHRLHGYTAAAARLGGFPLPGGAGGFPVLADLDGDDATEVIAGTGTDGDLWIYDAGPGTRADAGWPSPGGGPARTRSDLAPPALSPLDDASPAGVESLTVRRETARRVVLEWPESSDEGPTGRPARYEVARATQPFAPEGFDGVPLRREVPAAPGTNSLALEDAPAGLSYYFAVRAIDAAGNRSPVSGIAALEQGPPAIATGVVLRPARNPSGRPVELRWLAGADVPNEGRVLRIFDVTGRLVARLPVDPGFDGLVRWDARDPAGRPVPPGLFFARVETAAAATATRFVLIR